jgi:hypothetical protein
MNTHTAFTVWVKRPNIVRIYGTVACVSFLIPGPGHISGFRCLNWWVTLGYH